MLSKTLRIRLIAGAALLLLAAIGTLMISSRVAAQGPPGGIAVNIVGPVPLPVTGSTTVSGAVAASQSGPWNVGITGQPVRITGGNAATAPVLVSDVDAPGRNPLEVDVEVDADLCSTGCTNLFTLGSVNVFDLPAVPAQKRWIITRIAGQIGTTDSTCDVTLQSQRFITAEALKAAFYGPFFIGRSGQLSFNAEVSTSYGPGETPHVRINCGLSAVFSELVFNGYLISAP